MQENINFTNSSTTGDLVFVNGSFVPRGQAVISIDDRGAKFGDGVFETIRIYNGVLYQWPLHLKRLQGGLVALKINAGLENLKENCLQLIKKNESANGFVRISVSRGGRSKGYLPVTKDNASIIIEIIKPFEDSGEPVDLFLSTVEKISMKALPINYKTMQGLNSILARLEAEENGCFEALMTGSGGQICECSSSNVFWYKEGVLHTPSLESGALDGTIRDFIIKNSPYKVKEAVFKPEDLQDAEEVFITNVSWIVKPVKLIKPLGLKFDKFAVAGACKALIEKDVEKYAASNQA